MLLEKLQADLKDAQLARDEVKVSTLRLLLSEVKNREISKGGLPTGGLSDEDIISVILREVKKRKEAAESFRSGDREESAAKEDLEAEILEGYLPARMSNEELTKIVDDTIKELEVTSVSDMGKVMGVVMGKVKGQADGTAVSNLVKERLS